MQRLISIRLRSRNIILKSSWNHMILAVNNTQSLITIANRINTDTKSHNICKLLKRSIFQLHFPPNGIRAFLTPRNCTFNTIIRHIFFELADNFRHDITSLFAQKIKTGNNRVVSIFIKLGESNFIHFFLNFLHTDSLGKRCINIQGFLSDSSSFFRRTKMQGSHIMKSVC